MSCPGCLQRDERIAALEQRVAELEGKIRDLSARLRAHAANSSLPPAGRQRWMTRSIRGLAPASGLRKTATPDALRIRILDDFRQIQPLDAFGR